MWIITKNYIDDSNMPIIKSADCPKLDITKEEDIKKFLPYKFLIVNGDGELDYEGYSSSNDDNDAFAPLDDYASEYIGSTEIKYWNKKDNKWKSL